MRFLLIFIWLIFLLSCAPTTKEEHVKDWLYYYDLGMSALSAKNYSEAIANFFIATQKAPNEPKVWNSLGIAYMEVSEYEKAESAFRKALEVDKKFTEARLNLGVVYFRKKDYENALREIRTVLADESFPHKHIAFYYLARVYKALDNQNLYLENLRKATAYNPMFFEAQLELANAYEEMGDYRSALDVYRNLLDNGIRTPQIELNMARLLFYVEDYENAKLFIKRLIENKQADANQKTQAYELLSQILVKEQETLIGRKRAPAQKEREEPKAEERAQDRPPKEEPIANRTEPETTKPERKTKHKPIETRKTQDRPPKEEPIANRTEPETIKPERKTENKPVETRKTQDRPPKEESITNRTEPETIKPERKTENKPVETRKTQDRPPKEESITNRTEPETIKPERKTENKPVETRKTQDRPPKEEPIANRTEPETIKPERKTENKPVEVQRERVFRIQLGAFSSEDRAKAWKERIEKELGINELIIVEQLGIYKVLYGSFKSRAEAEAQVRRLRSYNLYGFIVQD